ncbi:MAG TPA: BTAD domain-containing putative transcriptional regulator, partial [Myxococcota bacterium]|nr:BTAD domain-containing putative transcriptional regulator [Myxococcota bacterium]
MTELRVLGPVQLWTAKGQIDLGHARQRCVLAALAVELGRPVSADTLIERVWDGDPPKSARSGIYSYITKLRRALREASDDERPWRLERHGAGYLLDADPDLVDLHLLRRLVQHAARERDIDDTRRVELLDEAIQLWRGEPLGGLGGGWAARVRQSLTDQRVDMLVLWAQAKLRLDAAVTIIGDLRHHLIPHPLAEPLIACLVDALCKAGRRAEALEQYEQARRQLREELGVEPGPQLRELHREILRQDATPAVGSAQPSQASQQPQLPHTIPAQLPRDIANFCARRVELDELRRALAGGGLATISGTAGVGKTALAVHWAHRSRHLFRDGQLYIDMHGSAPVPPLSPLDALGYLLGALGVAARQIPQDEAAAAAMYRSMLVERSLLVL